ncbi:MAG: 3-deoxy-D-manno-octulosonic acid transferase [Vicinamibacteraceae bacterium]|nr:3-deoxy-D-manno-octulosonic acid transferase [Vicinamibacteraceae bacterium]
MYFLYNLALAAGLVVTAPWWLWRGWRDGKYLDSMGARFGMPPPARPGDGPLVWVHAVSVGETLAARPLLSALRERLPGHRLVVSTTTRTGQGVARSFGALVDAVFYCPLDFAWSVGRVVEALRPHALVVMETELWPSLLREARRRGVKTMMANGRISETSATRYARVGRFTRRVLGDLDLLCMQDEASAARARALGADPARVHVTGNLKFDAVAPAGEPDAALAAWLAWLDRGGLRWLVAASTLAGEEAAVLDAYAAVRTRVPDARLLLAARHPERFDDVVALAGARGWRVVRRTALAAGTDADRSMPAPADVDIVVLDTIGELARVFAHAEAAFVGGSLVDAGGHNLLEPAWFGTPVVTGPSMHNFRALADLFSARGARVEVADWRGLADTWTAWLTDDGARRAAGRAAFDAARAQGGATVRTLDRLVSLLDAGAGRA